MPLLVLLPLLAWLAAILFNLPPPLFNAVPFPLTAGLAMALAGLLAAVMGQWTWLYWLALLGSGYASLFLASPTNAAQAQSLALFLPLAPALAATLLAALPRQPVATARGLVLLAFTTGLPLLTAAFPPVRAYELLTATLPATLLEPAFAWTPVSLLVLMVFAGLTLTWILILTFKSQRPDSWGFLACWLALAIVFVFRQAPREAGWTVLAASFSVLLALALQMLNLAYYDELTGLPQRRALMARLRRLGRRSAVTMLDVDHFKKFNDTYGHDVGDQVLRLLGSVLNKEAGFQAYRYGGEEFTLVFNHDDEERIEEALERVRERVASYPFRLRSGQRPKNSRKGQARRGAGAPGKTFQVTISLGCALRREGERAQELLKRADTILYKAKQAGRNRAILKS